MIPRFVFQSLINCYCFHYRNISFWYRLCCDSTDCFFHNLRLNIQIFETFFKPFQHTRNLFEIHALESRFHGSDNLCHIFCNALHRHGSLNSRSNSVNTRGQPEEIYSLKLRTYFKHHRKEPKC